MSLRGIYRYVRAEHGGWFRHVGILGDGTLYNPNGYPEADVRAAVAAADARRADRRRVGAAKAAETRRRRRALKLYAIVEQLRLGHRYGPRHACVLCGKALSDPPSITRGIGSECWGHVLEQLEQREVAR